jgi:hypothetical protein
MKSKVRCVGKLTNMLQYVKLVKTHSGLGLKEAKDFCDMTISNQGLEFILEIRTSVQEFEKEIREHFGNSIQVCNREKERQMKLISLGLGDKSDLIELLAEEMASELAQRTRHLNNSPLYSVFTDYMADVLTSFNAEQLDELFNNKLIKEKEQNG